ncbi:hypothetical protein AADU03_004764 [Escherichia coli]
MQLIAYWVGGSVIAAGSPEGAVVVMQQHEDALYTAADVVELNAEELELPVDDGAPETFGEALARCQAESPVGRPGSRQAQLRAGEGRPQLILWDLPSA